MKLSAAVLVAVQVASQADETPFTGNDIRYTQEQIDYFEEQGNDVSGMLLADGYQPQKNGKAVVTDDHWYHHRWSNDNIGFAGPHLRVPYRLQAGHFSNSDAATIVSVMEGMNDAVGGCIEFYDDTDTQLYAKKYVQFQSSSSGCWAQVGYVGHHGSYDTNQPINLSNGCVYRMVIEHEFLHAMGIFHEQSRPDRDQWINIHWDNIIEDYHSQYRALDVGDWLDQNSPYDGDSVMHYPANGFITTEAWQAGEWTMTDKETGEPVQWPRAPYMSPIDIEQLKLMYPDYCGATTTQSTTQSTSQQTTGDTTQATTTGNTATTTAQPGDYCESVECDGLGEYCQEPPSYMACHPISAWPRPPNRTGTLGVVSDWGPVFSINFQFEIIQTSSERTNMFHMGVVPNGNNADLESKSFPGVDVLPNSNKLMITYGDLAVESEELMKTGFHHIQIAQNWAFDGKLMFSVQLDGQELYKIETADRKTYSDVSVHFSSPYKPSTSAVVNNFHISSPMKPCGGQCVFDSANCPTTMATDVVWVKNPKASKPFMSSPDGLYVKTVIKNLANLPTDLRDGPYTGFLMLSKKKCGKPFFKKILDGTVKVQMFDNEQFGESSYDINYMSMRESDSNNLVIQFRQNKKPTGTATQGNTGNAKKDLVRVVYTGLSGVAVTDADKCFAKVQIAVMKDSLSAGGNTDWTQCVSSMRTLN